MTGRIALLYIETVNGWRCLTPHSNDQAGLDSLSIDWGTEHPWEQPEPPVMTFSIQDRTGEMAGDALHLANASVWLQKTDDITWNWLDVPGTWESQSSSTSWDGLADLVPVDIPSTPSQSLLTVFRGTVNVGGVVRKRADDWLIELKATGVMVNAKRSTGKGPTSGDPVWAGWHWTGSWNDRVTGLANRMNGVGAPSITGRAREWMDGAAVPVAPYASDSYPDLLTILHRTTGHSPNMPVWQEGHARGESATASWTVQLAGMPAAITLDGSGALHVTHDNETLPMIPAAGIAVDSLELGIPDPMTGVSITGRSVTTDQDGRANVEDAQTDISAASAMPINVLNEKSISIESDAILSDTIDPSNVLDVDEMRDDWRRILLANSNRLRPQGLRIDSDHLDDTTYECIFTTAPSWPFAFIHNIYTTLTDRDGVPSTSGSWLAIGGTLSYQARPHAVWSNDLTLHPLPRDTTTGPIRWVDLRPVGCAWKRLPEFTWMEFGQIDTITTSKEEQ